MNWNEMILFTKVMPQTKMGWYDMCQLPPDFRGEMYSF